MLFYGKNMFVTLKKLNKTQLQQIYSLIIFIVLYIISVYNAQLLKIYNIHIDFGDSMIFLIIFIIKFVYIIDKLYI